MGNVDHFRQVDPAVHLFEERVVVSPVLQPLPADVAADEPDLVGAGLFAQTRFAEFELGDMEIGSVKEIEKIDIIKE